MKRLMIAVVLVAWVLGSACGGGGQQGVPATIDDASPGTTENGPIGAADERALAHTYVSEICEPFAEYFEEAIGLGFPEFQGVTSPDEMAPLFRSLRANAQRTYDALSAVQPPGAMRDVHEQVLTVLETETAGYQRFEAALEEFMRTGDVEVVEQALEEADELANLAGIGATGFFPADVPEEYEEAWQRECVPRLNQIPGAGE